MIPKNILIEMGLFYGRNYEWTRFRIMDKNCDSTSCCITQQNNGCLNNYLPNTLSKTALKP